jgi:hypothetical protein
MSLCLFDQFLLLQVGLGGFLVGLEENPFSQLLLEQIPRECEMLCASRSAK